jgi:hypothetical protein
MKIISKFCLLFFLIAGTQYLKAQDEGNPIDTLTTYVNALQTRVAILEKLKITGYIQMQWQKADTLGIASFAGGNFPATSDNRFNVRRGRIKFTYNGSPLNQYVLQFDVTEKGLGIKDAYLNFKEPFLQAFGLQAGVFDRPFGFEISYSSSSRESPERSRMFQTLFPGERDLGAKLFFQMPKTSNWNFLRADAGLFTGNGTNTGIGEKKDFIGHLMANRTAFGEKLKFGVGVSYYYGYVLQSTDNYYDLQDVSGTKAFVKNSNYIKNEYKPHRIYKGIDGQLTFESPLGFTTLRGEYITGQQVGSSSSTTSWTTAVLGDTYVRKFSGAYAYFLQTINGTPLTALVKYDFYDPNTDVSGDQIGATLPAPLPAGTVAAKTGVGDIKYTTIGLGLVYAIDSNIKLTLYYDMVKNENTTNLPGATKLNDYRKDLADNVLTIRLQYKF